MQRGSFSTVGKGSALLQDVGVAKGSTVCRANSGDGEIYEVIFQRRSCHVPPVRFQFSDRVSSRCFRTDARTSSFPQEFPSQCNLCGDRSRGWENFNRDISDRETSNKMQLTIPNSHRVSYSLCTVQIFYSGRDFPPTSENIILAAIEELGASQRPLHLSIAY